jgi:EmrB/QacA subfamily drug resistance transporter
MIGFVRPPCDTGVIQAAPALPDALSPRCKRLTLAATILGSSMAFIDSSVVNIALPAIQQALQADAASTQWIVNGYLLLLGALVLTGGSAADLYGRRRIFLLGIAVFTAASIACGLAPDIEALVVSRAVQGLGAALLTPASLAMLGATFEPHERSRAIGLWAGVGALVMAAGPVLGGWLVDHVSWRAIFLLNIPLAIAAAGLAAGFARESRDPRAIPLDWKGSIAAALGLAAIAWALGAIPDSGFHDTAVLGALGAGLALLASFVAIEAKSGPRAMMPLSLYRSRNFSGTNALTLMVYFALGGALYYLPFGLIRLGGYSATQAGAALLPLALIMGFGASFAGAVADRYGPRLSLAAGPIIASVGLTLLAFAPLTGSYWVGVFPAICVFAIGMTVTVPPLTSTVMTSVGDAHAGIASGVSNAVSRVAALFAVAVFGAVLFASFSHQFAGLAPAQASEALNAVLAGQAGVTAEAKAAFDRALRIVLLLAALCALLGGVIGWLWIRPVNPVVKR